MKNEIHKKNDVTVNKQYPSDMYALASLLTAFLRELPSPILSYSDRNMFVSILSSFRTVLDIPKTVTACSLALRRIDPIKRRYLVFFLNLYYSIAQQAETNKMTFSSSRSLTTFCIHCLGKIAICVAPSFFSNNISYISTTEEVIQMQITIISTLIALYPLICSVWTNLQ